MAEVASNRYKFPAGYANAKYPTATNPHNTPYNPWNGASLPSPGLSKRGASQQLAIASVPADLSTLIVTAPNGAQYKFQFVYNASVQNSPGSIAVPLPASGASTAAQVTTALTAVLQLAPATTLEGVKVFFPWQAISGDATHVTLNYTVDGAGNALGGTQVTITQSFLSPAVFTLGPTVPGKAGQVFAVLPGI